MLYFLSLQDEISREAEQKFNKAFSRGNLHKDHPHISVSSFHKEQQI